MAETLAQQESWCSRNSEYRYIAFLVTVGLCLFIVKRYIPPRFLLVILIPVAAYIIPTLGALRGKFWELVFAGNWNAIQSASQEGLEKVAQGKTLELRNATLVMDYATQLDQYGYGKTCGMLLSFSIYLANSWEKSSNNSFNSTTTLT
jgi:hypothetical protein